MAIPIAMFEQPWQWAVALVIVLVLFNGSRIKDVMASLGSAVEEFKRGLAGGEPMDDAPIDDELFGYVLVARRNRERFLAAVARQEEIISRLLARGRDSRVMTARLRRERERHEYRLTRMRMALEVADRLRSEGFSCEAIERRQVRARSEAIRHAVRLYAAPRYVGKNLHGVPICTGELLIPPASEDRHSIDRLYLSLVLAFTFAVPAMMMPSIRLVTAGLVIGAVGSALSVFAAGYDLMAARLLRRRFGHMAPSKELSARSGTPELTYLLAAREKGILPKYIIDGVEYSDVNELGDAAVLLRPAETPEPMSFCAPPRVRVVNASPFCGRTAGIPSLSLPEEHNGRRIPALAPGSIGPILFITAAGSHA